MSRFKIIFLIALLFGGLAHAQEEDATATLPETKTARASGFRTFAVSYLSWTEFVELDNGTLTDSAYANFYGLALTYEKEGFKGRWGSAYEGTLMFGQANAGGSQTVITPYQTNYRSWYGAEASYRLAYRLSGQITLSLGPFAMVRQVTFPSENNIEVKSGSQGNGGVLADLRYRLTPKMEVRQMIGTMAFKASTIWSLGLGYKF